MHRIAGLLMGAMEVTCIVEKGVIGREIRSTSKPPDGTSLEIPVIEMHRRDIGITGMQHHRRPGGKPRMSLGFWPLFQD